MPYHFKLNICLAPTNQPLDIALYIQFHVQHGNAGIPCLLVSLRQLAKYDVILSTETGGMKQRRLPDKILHQ